MPPLSWPRECKRPRPETRYLLFNRSSPRRPPAAPEVKACASATMTFSLAAAYAPPRPWIPTPILPAVARGAAASSRPVSALEAAPRTQLIASEPGSLRSLGLGLDLRQLVLEHRGRQILNEGLLFAGHLIVDLEHQSAKGLHDLFGGHAVLVRPGLLGERKDELKRAVRGDDDANVGISGVGLGRMREACFPSKNVDAHRERHVGSLDIRLDDPCDPRQRLVR